MSLKLGNTDINKGYLGGTEIKKAYLGNTIVFDNTSDTRFITTHNIASNGETLTLPYSGNNETDWGDGTITATGNSHTYTNSGVYTVKISGVVDDWKYNNSGDKDKILTVENWGEGFVFDISSFAFCSNLNNVQSITSIISWLSGNSTFRGCNNLEIESGSVINFESNVNCFSTFNGIKYIGIAQFLNSENIEVYWSMFQDIDLIESDIEGLDFRNAETIRDFMKGGTPTSFSYQRYDALLIKWDKNPSEGGLDFGKLTNLTTNMGTIQYSSAGASAHASLVAKGLIITDGGQNAF